MMLGASFSTILHNGDEDELVNHMNISSHKEKQNIFL